MHAVFRLKKHDALVTIDNFVSHFQAAFCRQIVHELRLSRRRLCQLAIHLKASEGLDAAFGFFFLPHAGPDICVNYVCSCHGLMRIARLADMAVRIASFQVGKKCG